MKKYYKVTLKWTITHTTKGFFQYGESRLLCPTKNKVDAINQAIEFAQHLPYSEFASNNINEKDYMDDCKVLYRTSIEKIINVEIVER